MGPYIYRARQNIFQFRGCNAKNCSKIFFLRSKHHVCLKLRNLNHLVIRGEQSWHNIAAWLNNLNFQPLSQDYQCSKFLHTIVSNVFVPSRSLPDPTFKHKLLLPQSICPLPNYCSRHNYLCYEIVSEPVLVFTAQPNFFYGGIWRNGSAPAAE